MERYKGPVRQCSISDCEREIRECMGFVVIGDVLEVEEGKRDRKDIREMCGWCDLRFWGKDFDYIKTRLQDKPTQLQST